VSRGGAPTAPPASPPLPAPPALPLTTAVRKLARAAALTALAAQAAAFGIEGSAGGSAGLAVSSVGAVGAAAAAAAAAGCRRRPAPPAPDVAARIGDTEVRYSEFQEHLSRTLGDSDAVVPSDVLSQLFDQFLDERLLVRLAVERGLVSAGSAPRQAIDALLRAAAAPPPGDAEIEAYYNLHRRDFARPERVRLRQILTEDRRTAQAALQAVQRGEDFAAVARRVSHDASAGGGGYQGELARSDLPPALVDVIFALQPGEVSRVVPAAYGFHIFQVVARLPEEVVPLAAARGEIASRLERERADAVRAALVRQVRARYNAKVYEHNLPFEYEGPYGESHTTKPPA
jgi:peptidyl-prolyl cis-trans isomerase C